MMPVSWVGLEGTIQKNLKNTCCTIIFYDENYVLYILINKPFIIPPFLFKVLKVRSKVQNFLLYKNS